jgi:hypothetical protein
MGISSASDGLAQSTINSIEKEPIESSSKESDIGVEKGAAIALANSVSVDSGDNEEEATYLLSHEEPFPLDPDAEEETHQFTIRAVLVGCLLGGVIAASKYVFYLVHHPQMRYMINHRVSQCLSRPKNRLDVWSFALRIHLWIRHS